MKKRKKCPWCDERFAPRRTTQVTCLAPACRTAQETHTTWLYYQTPHGKATRKKHRTSEKGLAARARYDASEKGKACRERYYEKRRRAGAARAG